MRYHWETPRFYVQAMTDSPQPPQSVADFLRVLRASGLVPEERLSEAVKPWRDAAGPVPDELMSALVDADLLTPWQIEQLRKGKHKGFMLGKYRLLKLLGAGGMSSVYLAENTTLRQKRAIKVLPIKRNDQSSYLARFEREAQASSRLGHQNIARAFDLETSGSIHYIVMEYVEGTDLHAKVKQEGPLDIRDAAEYVRQAAVGLQYAHEEGFVHRDIKPANLILDKRGTVKILDLGLALGGDDEEEASLTREHDEKVLGTADYLAPEQARDSHKAEPRSDIYSLGCTLYYLLIGRAPFAKGSLGERIRAHMNEPPPNPLDQRPDVPPAIAELYFRMMAKHPDARPQSAREVADALGAWLASTATTKPRETAEPPRRSLRRNPGSGVGPATGSDAARRLAPPGPVVRSGPGSGSGPVIRSGSSGIRSTSGSGAGTPPKSPAAAGKPADTNIDLSSLSFEPPAASGQRPAQKVPRVVPGAASGGGKHHAFREQWRKLTEKQFAGLPLMFWIVVGIAALAVIGLGAGLLLR